MRAAEHQGESRSGWCAVAERRAAFCVLFEPQAPRFLCDVAGADRVVLGSDYPFPIGDPEPARVVCDKPLTAAERRAILGETAARIFHIDCSCIDDC
jgi:aminocarboxymuconate-semialdehyde decarboxylase